MTKIRQRTNVQRRQRRVRRLPRRAPRRHMIVQKIAHPQISSVLHQQLHHVPRAVHDGAHLLKRAVDQRHASPFQHLEQIPLERVFH